MAVQNESGLKTFTADVALGVHLAVKLKASSGTLVEVTGADEELIGVTQPRGDGIDAADNVNVKLKNNSKGTFIMTAGAAIAEGADLETGLVGKVITQTTGTVIGKTLEGASADGDEIEVLLT